MSLRRRPVRAVTTPPCKCIPAQSWTPAYAGVTILGSSRLPVIPAQARIQTQSKDWHQDPGVASAAPILLLVSRHLRGRTR